MGYWRNQKGNKKISEKKWQWKHDNSKPMGCSKAVLRGKFIAIQSYLKKQEKKSNRQPNFKPKTIGKRRITTTTKPKLVEGKKS